jgi:hypothetical protein
LRRPSALTSSVRGAAGSKSNLRSTQSDDDAKSVGGNSSSGLSAGRSLKNKLKSFRLITGSGLLKADAPSEPPFSPITSGTPAQSHGFEEGGGGAGKHALMSRVPPPPFAPCVAASLRTPAAAAPGGRRSTNAR